MTPYRKSPRPLGLALDHERRHWAPETLLSEVQTAWPEVVGAMIAEQATPVRVGSGVLTVSCAASVWAQELDLMGPLILERLGALLRRGSISRIRCITVPVRDPG